MDAPLLPTSPNATSAANADALPGWMRYVGIPLAGIFLTLFFIHLGFPYESLVARGCQALSREHGMTIRYYEVRSHIGLLGPGVKARDVVVSRPGEEDLAFEQLILRPAWSTSWLRGQPSLYVDAQMAIGRARGAIRIGEPLAFDGSFEDIDLAALPTSTYSGLNLRGSLDADIDLYYDEEGRITGWAELSAREGSASLPGQPIAIPFDSFDVRFSMGGEDGGFLTLESAELEGPMISVSASGEVARGARGSGQIDIELKLVVVDENLKPILDDLGVRLDDRGEATARLGGSLSHPVLR